MNNSSKEFSSFRDPSGIVFTWDGKVYRQINKCYSKQYKNLMQSGLYSELTDSFLLIRHQEIEHPGISERAIVIYPEQIPFISYPYEWSFSQLQDAALITLKIHRKALDFEMILKDASAYNVQFLNGKPIFIDTLSFDFYEKGAPWIAYGQFCRHFLAPLLLMVHVDTRLNRLLSLYLDGIPLDLANTLLDGKGGFFAKQHINWHARAVAKHSNKGKSLKNIKIGKVPKKNLISLVDSLIIGIESLKLSKVRSQWSDYTTHTSYSEVAAKSKKALVREFLSESHPSKVWDFGANDGSYSRLALECGAQVVAFDTDHLAVERNYLYSKKETVSVLPLIVDLTNPSPGIGFANLERKSIGDRQKADCILMLAVLHHLTISNNVPMPKVAEWLASLCKFLIIEFVPKEDSQVQLMLSGRVDIFSHYNEVDFEKSFEPYFLLRRKNKIDDSLRVLYLYEHR